MLSHGTLVILFHLAGSVLMARFKLSYQSVFVREIGTVASLLNETYTCYQLPNRYPWVGLKSDKRRSRRSPGKRL
jgi:hypothetical protein